jgi:DNA-binding HxlR family transcriptional regulator
MRPFDVFSDQCPSRSVLDDVVGRWPALVLLALADNPARFSETARTVGGISDRMLARTLRTLETDGLVHRTETGRRVDYALTEAGAQVAESLAGVVRTVYTVAPEVLAARARTQGH